MAQVQGTSLLGTSLGDLVVANPGAARVFEQLGLDYCCHGQVTLRDACAAAGLDEVVVAGSLAALEVEGDTAWAELGPVELAAHITATHHRYLHDELPLLVALAEKVASVHGGRHPELAELERLVRALHAELEPHMLKEERVLFPAIEALVGGRRSFPFGSVANPIRVMVLEHDQAGELLAALRRATDGYAVPSDGCASYRSLYERLDAVEADTHLHVHKENHVLFPAAVALEAGEG